MRWFALASVLLGLASPAQAIPTLWGCEEELLIRPLVNEMIGSLTQLSNQKLLSPKTLAEMYLRSRGQEGILQVTRGFDYAIDQLPQISSAREQIFTGFELRSMRGASIDFVLRHSVQLIKFAEVYNRELRHLAIQNIGLVDSDSDAILKVASRGVLVKQPEALLVRGEFEPLVYIHDDAHAGFYINNVPIRNGEELILRLNDQAAERYVAKVESSKVGEGIQRDQYLELRPLLSARLSITIYRAIAPKIDRSVLSLPEDLRVARPVILTTKR